MISYREDFKLWWPDYDHKPVACHARVLSHIADMDVSIALCRQRRNCIQAGGHAGLWPLRLAGRFSGVYSFECEPTLYECMKRNVQASPWASAQSIVMLPFALGDTTGPVKLRPHVSAGSWRVDPEGTVPVEQVTIDSMNFQAVDAIFLDIEGYEAKALEGGRATITKFKPVIHVEELPRHSVELRAMLKSLGYREAARIHSDHIWIPL